MITKRPARSRWHGNKSWIETWRTFSFPPYQDPRFIHFSSLQTINDDRVQPRGMVSWHEHKNMEIFGYVVEGTCRHVDSLKNEIDVPAGGVQRMSAGTGISHTEGNSDFQGTARYLQLWIQPDTINTEPEYNWHQFSRDDKLNNFCDITARLPIKADARLLAGIFTKTFRYALDTTRRYYVYVVFGTGTINGDHYQEGDGYSIENEQTLEVFGENSEIIMFDLK